MLYDIFGVLVRICQIEKKKRQYFFPIVDSLNNCDRKNHSTRFSVANKAAILLPDETHFISVL